MGNRIVEDEYEAGRTWDVLSQALQKRIGAGDWSLVSITRTREEVLRDAPSAAIIYHTISNEMQALVRSDGNETYFDIRVALHDLLDTSEWQGWMAVVGSLLLCSINLPLPERAQEVIERLSRLDEWLRRRHCRGRGCRLRCSPAAGLAGPGYEIGRAHV